MNDFAKMLVEKAARARHEQEERERAATGRKRKKAEERRPMVKKKIDAAVAAEIERIVLVLREVCVNAANAGQTSTFLKMSTTGSHWVRSKRAEIGRAMFERWSTEAQAVFGGDWVRQRAESALVELERRIQQDLGIQARVADFGELDSDFDFHPSVGVMCDWG